MFQAVKVTKHLQQGMHLQGQQKEPNWQLLWEGIEQPKTFKSCFEISVHEKYLLPVEQLFLQFWPSLSKVQWLCF